MRKLFVKFLVALFLFFGATNVVAAPNEFNQVVTATTTNTVVTLSFPTTSLLVVNDGAVSVHVTLASSIATTADQEIKAGESMSFSLFVRASSMGIITASGTSSVRVYAVEGNVNINMITSGGVATSVTNAGIFAVQEDGPALTALQTLDNIVSGSGVNISQIGGAAAPLGPGLETTALRVTSSQDPQIELFAALSTTSTSTAVSTSGYTVAMIHITADATWDRTGTFAIEVSRGGSNEFTTPVGAIEIREGGVTVANRRRHVPDPSAVALSSTANRIRGYLVDLTGFQQLRISANITGGTTGTMEMHVHLVSGTSGITNEMTYAEAGGTLPPIGQAIGGISGSSGTFAFLAQPHEGQLRGSLLTGYPMLGIRDNVLSTLGGPDDTYNFVRLDSQGQTWVTGTQIEDEARNNADKGVVSLAVRDDILLAGAGVSQDTDYAFTRVDNFGSAWGALTADNGARIPANSISGLKVDLGTDNDVIVTGAVTANAGTNLNTSALLTTTAHDAALGVAGTADSQVRSIQGIMGMTAVVVDGSSVTQPISAASLPLPSGAATSASQQTDALTDTQLRATAVPVSGTITATGPLTDAELRATAVPVDGSAVTQPISAASLPLPSGAATNAAQLADGHGVASTLVAGVLQANSPTTEVAIISLFDGSAETQIATTNLGASKAITITGSGKITQVCLVSSLGSVIAEDGAVLFFDVDPVITVDTADLTIAQAQTVVSVTDFAAADYLTSFASSAVACNDINKPFHSISHVVYHQLGATLLDDEDIELHVWYERRS